MDLVNQILPLSFYFGEGCRYCFITSLQWLNVKLLLKDVWLALAAWIYQWLFLRPFNLIKEGLTISSFNNWFHLNKNELTYNEPKIIICLKKLKCVN